MKKQNFLVKFFEDGAPSRNIHVQTFHERQALDTALKHIAETNWTTGGCDRRVEIWCKGVVK